MRANLVELCCGAAALSLHALGAKQAVLPYHGSKWKFREPLTDKLAERGITELDPVLLNDTGPWGRTWKTLLSRSSLTLVCNILRNYADQDPRSLYEGLKGSAAPILGHPEFAAQHLFLARLSFSGKAIGIRDGRWRPAGFNQTSAYGCAATDRFGPVNPMVPRLLARLEEWSNELDWGRIEKVSFPNTTPLITVTQSDAATVPVSVDGPTVIYIDPNYRGTTGFPNGAFPRASVVDTAMSWAAEDDAIVMVSEAEPITELVDRGWTPVQIAGPSPANSSPFKSKRPEWVTISPEV